MLTNLIKLTGLAQKSHSNCYYLITTFEKYKKSKRKNMEKEIYKFDDDDSVPERVEFPREEPEHDAESEPIDIE